MRNRLHRYLLAERRLAIFSCGLGTLAVLLGAWFLLNDYGSFYRGSSWSAVLLGGILLSFGLSNLRATMRWWNRLPALLAKNPRQFLAAEEERLGLALTEHRRQQLAEQLLLTTGMILLLAGALGILPPFGAGVGAGLSVLSAFLLITGLLRQWSRDLYRHELDMFRRDGEL